VGDPTGSNATAGLALRVTGNHKPLHHDMVEIPSGGYIYIYNHSQTHVAVINDLITFIVIT
jgi:hypothetical protein